MDELKEAVKLSKVDRLKDCHIVVTATVNDQIYVNVPTKGSAITKILEDTIQIKYLYNLKPLLKINTQTKL